jgi:2'-5' RNA ligase
LFFAVAVSSEIAARLQASQRVLAEHDAASALRFSVPEQAHYTLKFLGSQDAERRDAATRAGHLAASRASPFELGAAMLGVFPDERRAHTLWIGAGKGAAELTTLANGLDSILAGSGFPREDRPYVPHMTLARIKQRLSATHVRSLLAARTSPLGTMWVEEFALFESQPSPRGAVYVPLETFRLTRAASLP